MIENSAKTDTFAPRVDTGETRHPAHEFLAQFDKNRPGISVVQDRGSKVADRRIGKIVEIVEGAHAVGERLRKLSSETTTEVCSLVTDDVPSAVRIKRTQEINNEMYAHGIRSRTIYLSAVRENDAMLDHVQWLNDRGSEVRTLPDLPSQLIIADKTVAVLPFRGAGNKQAIIIYRDTGVVNCLQALFELNWISASPLGMTLDNQGGSLASEERALLEMLSLGWIDKEICVAIGKCERTAARRISDLMARLGAKTRFMAGVQAAKRNWI